MRYVEKTVMLEDGRSCLLRSPEPEDAAEMLTLLQLTAGETDFLTRYPEEPLMTKDEERAFLQKVLDHPRQVMVVGQVDHAIIACASVFMVSDRIKLRHRASFGVSIKKAYWHLGLGQILTGECIHLAREMGYEQLELQVLSGNIRARQLYERAGFEAWGSVKNGFKLKDGSYQDDVLMGLIL
jgi:RimJ/RimL family protein N-acetyltransferase